MKEGEKKRNETKKRNCYQACSTKLFAHLHVWYHSKQMGKEAVAVRIGTYRKPWIELDMELWRREKAKGNDWKTESEQTTFQNVSSTKSEW